MEMEKRSGHTSKSAAGSTLSLDDDTSRHRWHVEPAVERKNSSLAGTYGNGCIMDRTGISWASRHDHIVSIRRTNRKGMICVSRVVEANYQGVTLVYVDYARREGVVTSESRGEGRVERLVHSEEIEIPCLSTRTGARKRARTKPGDASNQHRQIILQQLLCFEDSK